AVLVPTPNVTNDHQTKKAMSLVPAGGAKMIADNELTGESLSQTVNEIKGDEELQKQMCRASQEQGIPDASKRLYDLVKQIITK
ncbi:glycosyltransferase, partial [Enterococcus faecium]|uniref:glycosyltransferase n=1 Tax=Enterococcus faecium TaxID=1352 RepID=UPI0031CDA32E